MLQAHALTFGYNSTPVLREVDFTASPGMVTGLVGPNGCGKTTLLRLLFASLHPQSGHVLLDDVPLQDLSRTEIAQRLSVVVQEDSGDTTLTVGEVVLLGRLPHHTAFARTTEADHEIAHAALRKVGIEHLTMRQLTALSGGERQRVMVARALTQQAPYLLLDEPTNHLDVYYQHEVLQLVDSAAATVIVLHDLNLASRYCDHVFVLNEGRVVAAGPPAEVLRPDLIEEVYRVKATPVTAPDGTHQLLLAPLPRTTPRPAPPATSPTGRSQHPKGAR